MTERVQVAWEREGTDEPCERGTVGCSVDHTATEAARRAANETGWSREQGCETW